MSSRPCRILLLLLAFTIAGGNLFAGKGQSLQHVFNARYRGQVLVQRHFFAGQRLDYDISGNLLIPGTIGSWTLDGLIKVQSIKQNHDRLIIRCRRLYVAFVNAKKRFYKVGKDEIDIVGGGKPLTLENLSKAFRNIFLTPRENLSNFVPSYWRPFLASLNNTGHTDSSSLPPHPNILNPIAPHKKKVKPPSPIYEPEPPYNLEARHLRFSGADVLRFTVDKNGHVSRVTIVKPAGLGLDDQAVKTVRTWRFHPAEAGGKPVPVPVTAEFSFTLSR